jgi:hypothetical protein
MDQVSAAIVSLLVLGITLVIVLLVRDLWLRTPPQREDLPHQPSAPARYATPPPPVRQPAHTPGAGRMRRRPLWIWFTIAAVLAVAAILLVRPGAADRWSALPHTSQCTPTPPSGPTEFDPTWMYASVPTELLVREVHLRHAGDDIVELTLEFASAPPPPPRRLNAPGTVSYSVLMLAEEDGEDAAMVSINSPSANGAPWISDSYNIANAAQILQSVEPSQNTVLLTLDLAGQEGFFRRGPFKPYISIVSTGTGQRTVGAPDGVFITFDVQECPWI